MVINKHLTKRLPPVLLFICTIAILVLTACEQKIGGSPTPTFIRETARPDAEPSPPVLSELDNSLSFDHVTLEDGLSQSTVNSIIQDNQGFMWFATNIVLKQ